MASAPETDAEGHTRCRPQPVVCLLHRELLPSLRQYLAQGGRKIDRWTADHAPVLVAFDQPHDRPDAFFNANTRGELRQLERR